jgi:hypothetical protein
MNLEDMYMSTVAGFGMTTATPTQRAICRAIEGRAIDDLASDSQVMAAFGGAEAIAALPRHPPLEFDLLAGIRTGKSQIAACRALQLSQIVDVSTLAAGEVPRVSILSLDLDKSDVVLEHLMGAINSKPALQKLLLGPPTGRSILVRHPSGRPIEIACVAGARAGGAVVSRWSAGCIFDEYARMQSSVDGTVVNYDDARRAVLGRLLPGATVLSIGSPWAPSGAAFERFNERFAKPSEDHVVVRARADSMNLFWWTAERIERLRRQNDTAFVTDVEAGFADPSSSCLAQSDVRYAVRKDGPAVLPPRSGVWLVAAMDPGARGNAWTLTLLASSRDAEGTDRFEVAIAKEWRGSSMAPLSPGHVLTQIRQLLAPWGLRRVYTDQHSADAIRDLGARVGLEVSIRTVVPGNQREDRPVNPLTIHKNDMMEGLAAAFQTRVMSIPDDRTLISDLLSIRRVVTRMGVSYDLPTTADGRHADYAPAIAMALAIFPGSQERARAVAFQAQTDRYDAMWALLGRAPDPPAVAEMSPAKRDAALRHLASGGSEDAIHETIWTRIARVQQQERDAAQAARAAEKGTS